MELLYQKWENYGRIFDKFMSNDVIFVANPYTPM